MLCSQCGAQLRESARYCNRCGARITASQTKGAATRQLSPRTEERAGAALRPSRPLRRPGDPGYGVAAPISRPLPRETTLPNAGEPFGLRPNARADLSDIPTEETPVAPSPFTELPSPMFGATPGGYTFAPGALRSVMPWPLPVGVTLIDRFQIVAIVEAQPDIPSARNTYRVVDLMGYARCWSCNAEHGSATASERFCPACGADMLGHEFLMTERRGAAEAGASASASHMDIFTQQDRSYQVTIIEPETPLFPFGVHMSVAAATHVGVTRAGDINEDSFATLVVNLAHDSRQWPLALAIVADGLGGHASGQEASRLASRIFIERLTSELIKPFVAPMGGSLPPEEAVEAALRDAVAAANTAVYEANVQGAADMGSTLVAAVVVGDQAWIANIGDSRGYVLDGNGLRRVTSDHSLVEQLIVSGMITPEERYTHIQRNRIFRSLGGDATVDVDIFTQKLTPGMCLLLCSDGQWEMTRDPEMERILRGAPDIRAACEALVASANANGGEDNITAIVLRADA